MFSLRLFTWFNSFLVCHLCIPSSQLIERQFAKKLNTCWISDKFLFRVTVVSNNIFLLVSIFPTCSLIIKCAIFLFLQKITVNLNLPSIIFPYWECFVMHFGVIVEIPFHLYKHCYCCYSHNKTFLLYLLIDWEISILFTIKFFCCCRFWCFTYLYFLRWTPLLYLFLHKQHYQRTSFGICYLTWFALKRLLISVYSVPN